jgi:2-methylcitrate dehydratase PrpD
MYSTSFEDIPPDVRHHAWLAVYDGFGGMLACSLLPVAHRMVDFVNLVGGPPDCTMVGFPMRTSVLNAALVNGTLGHGDEVDSTEVDGLGGRILPATMGAALATGQFVGASGRQVMRGIVLGHELSKRIYRVADQVERAAGRTSSRVEGNIDEGHTMGATVAAGITLGLPPDRMEVALGLACPMACGQVPIYRETEHMAKSFVSGGVGARNGVAAALMAKVGYDAPREIFDETEYGKHGGFFYSRLGVEDPGPEFLRGLGEEYSITSVLFKSQAGGGGSSQAPRQALLEVLSENGLSAADIAEIQVELEPEGVYSRTQLTRHPTSVGRDVLALAAVYGGTGFREAHDENYYGSHEVLSLRERIKFTPRHDWTRAQRFHTVVTVLTKDGRKLSKEHTYRLMSENDVDTKFSELVGLRAGKAKAKELTDVLKQLDTVNNVADVMARMELPESFIDRV